MFVVLFIDLDCFKVINDILGYYVGDEFLIEVVCCIVFCICGYDLLVCLGGDEFVVLFDNFEDEDDVEEVVSCIILFIFEFFLLDG